LTPQRARFVEEFVISLDPRDAARRAGLAEQDGPRLLASHQIQQAISLASRRALSRQQVYLEDTLSNLVALRDADPNELVELRRVNCRHCHGQDHEYQFTDLEHRHAESDHRATMLRIPNPEDRVPFDEKGGAGFRLNAPPAPDCPACDGDGVLRVIVKDTRTLSRGARLLYDGVKVGAGGSVEVKFRDRGWAEDRIARYAGMFNDRRTPSDPNRLSDDQLVDAVVALVEHGTVQLEHLPLPDDDPSITDLTPAEEDDAP
jgi:phage terminase small subunit